MEKEDPKCFVCRHEKSKHPTGDLDDECRGIYALRQYIFILAGRAGLVGFTFGVVIGQLEDAAVAWGPAFVVFGLLLWRQYRHPEARHQVSKEKKISGLYIAWLIAAVMLIFAAIGRYPHSFYTLLRCVCFAVFAYSAVAPSYGKNGLYWAFLFSALAALYNPIFRVHLDRSLWIRVNWFTIGMIVIAAVLFREQQEIAFRSSAPKPRSVNDTTRHDVESRNP